MKQKSFLFIVIVFSVLLWNNVFCVDFFQTSDIISHNIGDTLQLIETPDEQIEGYLYVFVSASSCPTCIFSTDYLYKEIKAYLNIKSFVFFNSTNLDLANDFHKEAAKNYEIILDRMGIYAKNFGVKFDPAFILLDKYGKLLAAHKLGTPDFKAAQIKEISNKVKSEELENKNNDSKLKIIKKIKLVYKNNPLVAGNANYFLYSKKYNQYYFRIMFSPVIFASDSNGICTIISDNEEIKKAHGFQGFAIRWFKKDSILAMLDMTTSSDHYISEYNIQTQKYYVSDQYTPRIVNVYSFGVLQNYDFVFSKYFYAETAFKLEPSEKIMSIITQDSEHINNFFEPDTIYVNNRLSNFAIPSFIVGPHDEIIIWQWCTDKLLFYNNKGEYCKEMKLHLPNTYSYPTTNLPTSLSYKYYAEVLHNYSSSTCSNILYDDTNGDIGLYYVKWINVDKNNPTVKNDRQYYLHLVNKDGNNLTDNDVLFPLDTMPFYIEGNLIYAWSLVNSELQIVIYKINI